jgi:hypothetical protein
VESLSIHERERDERRRRRKREKERERERERERGAAPGARSGCVNAEPALLFFLFFLFVWLRRRHPKPSKLYY